MTVVTEHVDAPQRKAADPAISAFVTANAGSGKTKTLIDRVARLLLAGAEPATILCVTYTKAAAAEMQRRLYDLLGGWSVEQNDKLADELAKLEGRAPGAYDAVALSKARALFARALETPGGLKIQTIHAFCEKLLRRFPVEAKVSPGFKVMDDAASAAVADAARKAVARHALEGPGPVAEAYARFSVALDFLSFQTLFRTFEEKRGALADYFARTADVPTDVWRRCGFEPPSDVETVMADALAAVDWPTLDAAAEVLAQGGKADCGCADALRAIDPASTGALERAFEAMFTKDGEGTPATHFATTRSLKAHPGLRERVLAVQAQLEHWRERVRAARIAEDTIGALTLAGAYLAAYEVEKTLSSALDFADLVEKSRALLTEGGAAAWVLYKLDGGIDHILVDEAQDTAPEQWEIVRALTEEYFASDQRRIERRLERNLFVVGDEKQSIYSFQGARPELLIQQYEHHRRRAVGAGFRLEQVPLLASWRSTPQVLSFVDATFAPPELAAAIMPRAQAEPISHYPIRAKDDGCVDLWPLEREVNGDEREAWDAPLDAESETSANRRLAEKIAREVDDLIARGDRVFDPSLNGPDGRRGDWRAARAGDVLILVRRRKALFEDILRALKRRKIPVAGADRLALSEHIVFDDLMALARFVQFPRDELNLAALLRSPFCEVSDESLYDLGHGRDEENLWVRLQRRGPERPQWAAAVDLLSAARALRGERPFEFYARILGMADPGGRSMRQKLLTRLGSEAEDALDEFLAQVLAAEQRGVHELESLAAAFASLDITVKREMEAGRDEVRVMTAHGAKGLEAPIVFVPETTLNGLARGSPLMETEDGGFLWCRSKVIDCQASARARERRARREEDEAYRLLYVALTRARDRLVLCGRINARDREENLKGWWGAINAAFQHPGIAPQVRKVAAGDGEFLRFGPDPGLMTRPGAPKAALPTLPAWARTPAAAEPLARYAPPSRPDEDDRSAVASPLARSGGLGRFRRGDLIHRLLQILPDLPRAERAEGAAAILAREKDLTDAQRQEMIGAAFSVLDDPRFSEVFGPGSRAEAPIIGRGAGLPEGLSISGRIDRLVVLPDRVLVVDFKTNRPSPGSAEAADSAYIRQMALYAAVLAEVFPGRRIEAALVWTDGPKLMAIPEKLLAQSLMDLGRGA